MKKILLIAILFLAFVLRVPFLDKFPAGLNADEAAIGYNAYSLIKTGLDEHATRWPTVFRSFDDYKPAVYFYLVLPFVYILGLSVTAVRLPSALLGVISVYFIYLLANQLFPPTKKAKLSVGHLAALLLAVSPWHLHFSRGGWEANAASAFFVIGLYCLVRSLENTKYLLLTTFSFVLALYTYHSLRIVIPLLFIAFVLIYFRDIRSILGKAGQLKPVLISVIIGFLLLLPLALQFTSAEGRSRFTGVSVFADEGPLWEALELRREDGNTLLARVLHNRYATYTYRFAKNYLSHFSPRFLFIVGDEIARSKVPGLGQAYLFTFPFFILGLLLMLARNGRGEAGPLLAAHRSSRRRSHLPVASRSPRSKHGFSLNHHYRCRHLSIFRFYFPLGQKDCCRSLFVYPDYWRLRSGPLSPSVLHSLPQGAPLCLAIRFCPNCRLHQRARK